MTPQQPPYEDDAFSVEEGTAADQDFASDTGMDPGGIGDEQWEGDIHGDDDFGAAPAHEGHVEESAPAHHGNRMGWLFAFLGLVIVAGGGGYIWHSMNKPQSAPIQTASMAPTGALTADIPPPVKIDSTGVTPMAPVPMDGSAMPTVAMPMVPASPSSAPTIPDASVPPAPAEAMVPQPMVPQQPQQQQAQAPAAPDMQTLQRLEALEKTVNTMQDQIRRSEASGQATDATLKQVVGLITDLRQKTQQNAAPVSRQAPARAVAAEAAPVRRGRISVSAANLPPEQRPVSTRWLLRAATPTAAWVAPAKDPEKLYRVSPGEVLSGVGKVQGIQSVGDRWVIVGSQGLIQ
ncbi:MAG: hypothetical protein IPI58_04390 [Alphaproteobacteria bacterium]|nr:MAG: hypothetical protein IPI58_04390 [Alphaproteobacteria bacterium]